LVVSSNSGNLSFNSGKRVRLVRDKEKIKRKKKKFYDQKVFIALRKIYYQTREPVKKEYPY